MKIHRTFKVIHWPPMLLDLEEAIYDFCSDTILTVVYLRDLEDATVPVFHMDPMKGATVKADPNLPGGCMVWEGQQTDKKGTRVYRVKITGPKD